MLEMPLDRQADSPFWKSPMTKGILNYIQRQATMGFQLI